MPTFSFKRLFPAVSRRSFAYAVGVLVLAAVVAGQFLHLGPGRGRISRLLISDASAAEFDLVPSKADAAGAAPDSAYVLTSKTVDVDAAAVKASLAIDPQVPIDVQKTGAHEWRITPKDPLPPQTIFKVTLAAEAASVSGSAATPRDFEWAFQVKDRFKVLSSIPRDRATDVPVSFAVEIMFSHDGVGDLEKHFSIEPAVEGRFETHGRTVVFVPKSPLAESTVYTVRVRKELGFKGSQETLGEEYLLRFETAAASLNAAQYFQASRDAYEFASGEVPTIQVNRSPSADPNVETKLYRFASADAFLASLRERDKLPWWSQARERSLADVSKLEQASSFKARIEAAQYVEYIRFPEALPRGFYLAELSTGKLKDQAWIQVGDAAAYVQVSVTDTLVWVNSLATKNPVAGAQVQLDGLTPAYRTSADGTAVFPTPKELIAPVNDADHLPTYLKVTAGPDTVIVPVANQNYDSTVSEASAYWRYLSTDRPLYQTTDTIHFWGVIKSRADGKPISKDLTIALSRQGYLDYEYRPTRILEQPVTIDAHGAVTGDLNLKNLKPDYYALELRAGDVVLASRWLNVSPYVKPAYQLTMTTDRKALFVGEAAKVDVTAAFFDGTPVPNLKLAVSADGVGGSKPYQLVTDASGKATFLHGENYEDCQQEYECWPHSIWFTARPEESEFAEITATASVNFFGPRIYTTSKVTYPAPGRARLEAKVRQIDLAGMNQPQTAWAEDWMGKTPAPNTALDVEVIKTWYDKVKTGEVYDFIGKTVIPTYRYDAKTENVESFTARTDGNGAYAYERAVEPGMTYKINIKAHDAEGKVSKHSTMLWYYDGRTTWEGGQSDEGYEYWYFKLPEKPEGYGVGETVEASFVRNGRLPQIESGKRFLFMQLHQGLQERAVSDDPVYRFPFETRDIPNVNLSGVYFNGKTYVGGEGSWSFWTSVPFKKSDRALKIETKADKAGYKPGEKVRLDVQVTDPGGKPVSASVNLSLIDEAYFAVAASTVDPLSELYMEMPSGTLFSGSSHLPPIRQTGGAEKGGCFLAGTAILMADGTTKPIEDVRAGDEVMTFGDPATARKAKGRVAETFQHVVRGWLTINGHINVTPEHRMYADYAFRPAGELKVGDWLLGADGQKVPIVSIETHEKTVPVFNFRVDPFHTYIAEGVYVHNDKGGGPRQVFTDSALFRTVSTGSNGKADLTFTLPDNLTSWRITSQAVSGNLYAGSSVSKIPVSLPAFVEPMIGKEYLVGDRVVAKLRAFGAALTASDEATLEVSAPSLGLAFGPLKAKAFASVEVPLPVLTAGRHDITYKLSTAKGGDSVLRPIEAVASRLQRAVISGAETLTTSTKLEGDGAQPITVVLSDVGQNRYYGPLERLSSSWLDRLDQAAVRPIARDLLKAWYGETAPPAEFEASRYQLPDGGLALLPYAASDLELSARVAAVAADRFDRAALAQYFYMKLEASVVTPKDLGAVLGAKPGGNDPTPEEVTLALGGLASIGEPILPRLQAWETREDLTLSERLTVAQAYAALGAGEHARALFNELLKRYGRTQGSYIWMEVDKDTQDDRSDIAARAAVLSARLGIAEHEGLWKYAEEHPPKDRLLDLDEAAYIRNVLPKTKPSPAKVAYTINGQRFEAELTGGRSHAFSLDPQEIGTVRFEQIQGAVAYVVKTLRPASALEGRSKDVSISREYLVNGKPTTSFKDGDLVEVRLTVKIDPRSPGYDYQITDLLPGGLMPVTNLMAYGTDPGYCVSWIPYGTADQRVTFHYWKYTGQAEGCGGILKYYARVATKGAYRAEPAMIQSYDDADAFGLSAEQTVTIE